MKSFLMFFIELSLIIGKDMAQIYDGYVDKLSYRPGETVTFYCSGGNASGIFPLMAFDNTAVANISALAT